MPTGFRVEVPAKMTSCIRLPRSVFADCSPSTQLMASLRFDFPHPLGPTIRRDAGAVEPHLRTVAKGLEPLEFDTLQFQQAAMPLRMISVSATAMSEQNHCSTGGHSGQRRFPAPPGFSSAANTSCAWAVMPTSRGGVESIVAPFESKVKEKDHTPGWYFSGDHNIWGQCPVRIPSGAGHVVASPARWTAPTGVIVCPLAAEAPGRMVCLRTQAELTLLTSDLHLVTRA